MKSYNGKKIIVAHEGKQHSFRTAEALLNGGMLYRYITTIYDRPWSWTRVVKWLLRGDARKKCASHRTEALPDSIVLQYCECRSLFRLFLSKLPKIYKYFPSYYDWLHDSFGIRVARYAIRHKVDAVIMYDTNANACFRYLKENAPHIRRILDVSIANRLFMKENFIRDIAATGDYGLRLEQEYLWNEQNLNRYKEEMELSQYFIVASQVVKKSLMFSGVKVEQILLAPYGVDRNKFAFQEKDVVRSSLRLIFVGQVNYRKGIHHLLKVITSFPTDKVELYLAGGYDATTNIYNDYKDAPNIHFLGFVTRDVLSSLYQKCDVFVFPTLGEGYGMVLLEALACGVPCIVSDLAGGNDAIVDGYNGFVFKAGDDMDLKEKIQWFIENPERLPEMSRNARESVNDMGWEDYGKKVVAAMKKIL